MEANGAARQRARCRHAAVEKCAERRGEYAANRPTKKNEISLRTTQAGQCRSTSRPCLIARTGAIPSMKTHPGLVNNTERGGDDADLKSESLRDLSKR